MIPRAKSSDRERHPTVWTRVVTAFLRRAEQSGLDRAELLVRAGMTEQELEDLDSRIALISLYELLEAIVELSGDRLALVHIAREIDLATFESLAFLVMTSPTLRVGVRAMFKYQRLFSDGERYDFEERDGFACLAYTPWGPPRLGHDLLAEMFAADVLVNGAKVAGAPFDRPRVRFRHSALSDEQTRELSALLGNVELELDQPRCEVWLRTADLDRRLAHEGQAAVFAFFEKRVEERLRALAPAGIASRVRETLMRSTQLLPDVSSLARRLHMGARTLQRRLHDEGTSLRELVDETRRARALPLLESGRPIAEIAYLLGYADPSAFHRAFRRWTDETPESYRERVSAKDSRS